jgi:hypothetical protein
MVSLLGYLRLLAYAAVAVDSDGLRVRVAGARAGLGRNVWEGGRALCGLLARAGPGDRVCRNGGSARVDGWLLVVGAQCRVVADKTSVREERRVAKGDVRDDWDSRSWVRRSGRRVGSDARSSEDWEGGVDGWHHAGDSEVRWCLSCDFKGSGAV